MPIADVPLSQAGDLAELYNEIVAGAPHCYPVTRDEFAITCPPPNTEELDFSGLSGERLLVALSGEAPVGFAHVARGHITFRGERVPGGFLHFLGYLPGNRAAAQELLEECEEHLRRAGHWRVFAFHGHLHERNYRFYHFGFPCLSDRLLHVHGLLCHNGFRTGEREVFLAQAIGVSGEPVPPGTDARIVVRELPGGDLPGVEVQALRGDEEIGVCYAESGGAFCRADEAQRILLVDGMGVREDDTGKGWGRYLLRKALVEARQRGFTRTVVSTALGNTRALLFYTNLGYRATDAVYALTKSLT
jgi:GNAT superfamily N-acetyltransferase